MWITVLVLGAGGYFGYKYYSNKKENERIQKVYDERDRQYNNLISAYDSAYASGDSDEIKRTAYELANFQFVTQDVLTKIYQQSLALLKNKPDLKPFALEMGRKKYSHFRENGLPTVYDESAIMNDINAAL